MVSCPRDLDATYDGVLAAAETPAHLYEIMLRGPYLRMGSLV